MPNRTPDVEISQCVKIILPWQLARLIGRNRGRQSDKILNSLESWYGTIGCYRVLENGSCAEAGLSMSVGIHLIIVTG